MNILSQLNGLAIIAVLLFLFFTNKGLPSKGKKTFLICLIIIVISLLLDIFSVIAIVNWRDSHPVFTKIACKTYVVSLIWFGWINLMYVCLDINNKKNQYKIGFIASSVITVLMSSVVYIFGIEIFYDGSSLYTLGPAVIAVYVFCLFYILLSVVVAIYLLKKKNSRRATAILISNVIWLLAAAIQGLNNELLLVGNAMAIGAMVLYIVMENPDALLDKTYQCFTADAFHDYVKLLLKNKTQFYALDVSFLTNLNFDTNMVNTDNEIKSLVKSFKSKKDFYIFKQSKGGIIVISTNYNLLKDGSKEIYNTIMNSPLKIQTVCFLYDNLTRIETINEFYELIFYTRMNSSDHKGELVKVSRTAVDDYFKSLTIENKIIDALDEDRVEVFFQPLYSIEQKKFISAEALCRIKSKEGKIVSPGEFIPVAEKTGLIKYIGERVFEKTCKFLHDTDCESLGLKRIEVNLAALQCDDLDLAEKYVKIAQELNVDLRMINLEITETSVSNAKNVLLENMNQMIDNGFKFSLDDFGKGASNLMYAVEMPVSIIKIDMELTKLYFVDEKAKKVVDSVILMSHDMELEVVAEGVETYEEFRTMSEAGVDYIQGYYFSRPISKEEFIEFLNQNNNINE